MLLKSAMTTKKSIIFFFPYYDVSGVPVLFIRFAKALSKLNYEVSVVDFEGGYMHSKIKNDASINFIQFQKQELLKFKKNSTIIMQSILPHTMPKNLIFDDSNKIIFWSLYQANFIPTIIPIDRIRNFQYANPKFFNFFKKYILKKYIKDLSELVNTLHAKNGLIFMSFDVYDFTKKFLDLNFQNPQLMPVCIDGSEKIQLSKVNEDSKKIKILWIGRLGDFKIHILNYLIKCLNNSFHLNQYKIILDIVGSGNYKFEIPKKQHPNFSIFHHENINHIQVKDYLLNTDICASMGTSAIESARYGIPTISLDFYYSKINFNYKFKWIYQNNHYDLGALIDSSQHAGDDSELDIRLNEFISNHEKISDKTFNYFNMNHNIKNHISTFEKYINNSNFYFSDFNPNSLKKSVFRKSYESFRKLFIEELW